MIINRKYIKMHDDVINTCNKENLKLLAGKTVVDEIIKNDNINATKEFYLSSEDMEIFENKCIDIIKSKSEYFEIRKKEKPKAYIIYKTDILATTIHNIMIGSGKIHNPQIVIYELEMTSNALKNLKTYSYKNSIVFAGHNLTQYLDDLYEGRSFSKNNIKKYTVFNESCSFTDLIDEAKKRGYITPKTINRYKQHRKWQKDKRNFIEKKYLKYADILIKNDEWR